MLVGMEKAFHLPIPPGRAQTVPSSGTSCQRKSASLYKKRSGFTRYRVKEAYDWHGMMASDSAKYRIRYALAGLRSLQGGTSDVQVFRGFPEGFPCLPPKCSDLIVLVVYFPEK